MWISLTRSGGLTGLTRTFTVDEDHLAAGDRAQLQALVDRAGLDRLPARRAATPRQPDRFQYVLELEAGARRQTLTVDEEAVTATLQPLLDWLIRHG